MDSNFKFYLRHWQAWTESYCAPVFFRDESGNRRNGSMTFLNTGEETLGITAGHVADRILACYSDKPGYGCQVGRAGEFDPISRFIARSADVDLATFHVSEQFLVMADRCPMTVYNWPPRLPSLGEKVLLGGYPGKYRQERNGGRQIDVTFVHFGVNVSSVSNNRFVMVLGIAGADALANERIDPQSDFGGISGGIVLRVNDSGLVARPEPVGIIADGSAEWETLFAHPLACLNTDGTFFPLAEFSVKP